MTDYELAIADFLATKEPEVITPVTTRAESKVVRRASWETHKERVERNRQWYKASENHADRNN